VAVAGFVFRGPRQCEQAQRALQINAHAFAQRALAGDMQGCAGGGSGQRRPRRVQNPGRSKRGAAGR
jgi:hypothetical protein